MGHVHTTWYRLVDGTQADPNDVSPDDNGVLRSKSGVAVVMRDGGVPRTSATRDKQPASASSRSPSSRNMTAADDKPAVSDREMKPAASGKGYRTRSTKGANDE